MSILFRLSLSALSILIIFPSCIDGPQWHEEDAEANYITFVQEVQPVLARGCSTPACHGQITRPLEIFASGLHRLNDEDLHLPGAISEEELRLNFWRASAFLFEGENPKQCQLLTKPLSPAAGGMGHSGGIQFEDISESDYQVLLSWVDSWNTQEAP